MNLAPPSSFFPWKPACWLRVEGPDAFDFLQGQFSNDLRALLRSGHVSADAGESDGGRAAESSGEAASGPAAFAAAGLLSEAVYGLWLNRKGRILGDGFVLRAGGAGGECFLVCSYETSGEALRAHLESFIVADEVELFDESASVAGLRLLDGAAAKLLSIEAGALAHVGGVFFAAQAGMYGGSGGDRVIEWVGPPSRPAARASLVAELSGAVELSFEEMERRRILAQVPAVPRDLGEGELPQEGGPDFERAAVSYTKGCYLGQEVMARVHSMGRVRRQLVRVAVPAPSAGRVPELPAPLYLEEKKVGELRTAVGDGAALIGLALVSAASLPQAAEPLTLSLHPSTAIRADG